VTFRPYPGLTAACLLMFAALCGLGTWQVERLHWKLALIAQVDANMKAPPLNLDAVRALPPDQAQYHRVTVQGVFDHARENYAFTTGEGGVPLYHVLTPLHVSQGWLMVDRGAVPKDRLDPASRRAGNVSGMVSVTGVWRIPDPPGAFTPAHKPGSRVWYARDLAGMAAQDGIRLLAPALLEAGATPNPGGWPKGGQTVVSFRNQHLSYAVTWFGLALVLLGVWLAYHISRGRIALK
jgi:surfeit locus 1 family protein